MHTATRLEERAGVPAICCALSLVSSVLYLGRVRAEARASLGRWHVCEW